MCTLLLRLDLPSGEKMVVLVSYLRDWNWNEPPVNNRQHIYHCVNIDKSTYHSVTKCCSIRFVEDLLSLKFFAGMSTCIQAKFYTGDPKIFDKFCCGHTNAELCGDK